MVSVCMQGQGGIVSIYIMVDLFKCKGISCTNRRNKKGQRIDPCSNPCLTGFSWDGVCPSLTNCRHPARYDWNQATLSGRAPYTDNFFNNRLWLRTSKALWKSTNTSPVSSSLSILNKILSVILIIVVSVELPEWKPDCSYSKIIANCFPEDILVETLLHVVEDFR